MKEDALFSSAAKGAIAFVSSSHVETPGNGLHLRQFGGWWRIVQSGCDANKECGRLRHGGRQISAKEAIPLRVAG